MATLPVTLAGFAGAPVKVQERLLFLLGFLSDIRHTGSVTPSSRRLARAVTCEIDHPNGATRILEVGAGTGVITQEILRHCRGGDTLDIYEMNKLFADHLRKRFTENGSNGAIRVFQEDVIASPPEGKYDYVICGLPLNNFPAETVRAAFETLLGALSDGGSLSFFQYMLGRPIQSVFSGKAGRRRLREVGSIMREMLEQHEYRRIPVLGNIPPALAHHLRAPR
jgi:phosphatidylserine decarboxylase